MPPLPELLTVDRLAAELGQTRRWVYRQVEERGMPCYRIGRALVFERPAVRAWLDQLASTPTPDMREPDLSRAQDSRDNSTTAEPYQRLVRK